MSNLADALTQPETIGAASNGRFRKLLPVSALGRERSIYWPDPDDRSQPKPAVSRTVLIISSVPKSPSSQSSA